MVKRLLVLLSVAGVLAIGFMGSASADPVAINIGKGELKIGAILQGGFHYSLADDEGNVNGQFTLNRARFLFWGTIVPDRVKYFVQTETKGGTGALDYKMILLGYIPHTSITLGRFLPNFSLYMPAPTSKLDMINYPVFLQYYAMWRQSGIQSATAIDNIDFNVGLFNGPVNNMNDDNDAKDVLLRAGFKPKLDALLVHVGGYAWLGNFLLAEDADMACKIFGLFGTLKREKLTAKGEFVMGSEEMGSGMDDVKSRGFYGHAGFRASPNVEVLGRFDFLDPDTDGEDDAWTWITFGLNYYIASYHAMIYLNYIMKLEQNDWGMSEAIKNNEIRIQFQVAP
jgi:hypothetical protein